MFIIHTSTDQLLQVSRTSIKLWNIRTIVKTRDVLSMNDKGSRVGSGPTVKINTNY